MSLTPIVIERTADGERAYDIFSRLLKDRIIFLGTEINNVVANTIVAQLLFLESQDVEKPIYLYINSPGGVIYDAFAIIDTMKLVRPPVYTINVGLAASAAALILAMGDKRYALPNSRIMIHQPLGGAYGQATDIEIHAKEILRLKEKIIEMLANATGQKKSKIRKDIERDKYMSPEEAKEYGLIDEILTTRGDE